MEMHILEFFSMLLVWWLDGFCSRLLRFCSRHPHAAGSDCSLCSIFCTCIPQKKIQTLASAGWRIRMYSKNAKTEHLNGSWQSGVTKYSSCQNTIYAVAGVLKRVLAYSAKRQNDFSPYSKGFSIRTKCFSTREYHLLASKKNKRNLI